MRSEPYITEGRPRRWSNVVAILALVVSLIVGREPKPMWGRLSIALAGVCSWRLRGTAYGATARSSGLGLGIWIVGISILSPSP